MLQVFWSPSCNSTTNQGNSNTGSNTAGQTAGGGTGTAATGGQNTANQGILNQIVLQVGQQTKAMQIPEVTLLVKQPVVEPELVHLHIMKPNLQVKMKFHLMKLKQQVRRPLMLWELIA